MTPRFWKSRKELKAAELGRALGYKAQEFRIKQGLRDDPKAKGTD